jgi:hypothetical protein
MKNEVISVIVDIAVTDEDIDDIMVSALEGGITYWADEARVMGDYLGVYASEQISRGGTLLIHDSEEEETYALNREKFLRGLKMFLELTPHPICFKYGTTTIDCCNIDANDADSIIQLALFGEVVYA